MYDSKDDVYYTGDNDSGDPVLESLDSRVRLYKNEKGARGAMRHIEHSGSERVEFCELKAVYIERQDVPDAPSVKDKPADNQLDKPGQASAEPPKEPPVIKKSGDWIVVDSFGRLKYVKKTTTSKPFFAVLDENGDLRGFGFDELAAWTWYSNLRRDVVIKLIQDHKDNNAGNGR